MKIVVAVITIFTCLSGLSQSNDTLQNTLLQPVVVTAYKEKTARESSLNIVSLKIDSLSRFGNYNLTDLLAKVPGVSMLSTGIAITKPVIRGLYGNRVLVLLSGLKFDNQQWQEEHGLGLSDIGLSRAELIKGSMGVLYGTEAMGGVINLIEEEKPKLHTKETDVSLKLNSNTLGGLLQAGFKKNKGKSWWRIRGGIENNADYSDGNNDRVLNSRFDGYYLKATYGFQRKRWTSANNLASSYNRFGFIFNDVYTFITPDDRWSRKLNSYPAHLVLLNILSSENKFTLRNKSKLDLNIGFQSNKRMENEGGGAISLNMHLFTFQYLLKWEKQVSNKSRVILSNLGSFEDNTNYGSRKIVPDANMQESNISAYFETNLGKNFLLENGVGIGEKWIKTHFTASVNGQGKEVQPFNKFSPYYNVYSGFTYFPNKRFNLKFNAATGIRVGNLAELSSNGLHEGVFTYEIGDPSLKNEQNITLNLFLNYKHGWAEISASPFYNFFYNYIYLAPTTEDWFGFPVYRYKQQNAYQYGTELAFTAHPVKSLSAGITYAGMMSKTQDGNYTPFIPAQKITPNINYTFTRKNGEGINIFTTLDHCFSQHHTAPNEIATPQYSLWNLGVSTAFKNGKRELEIGLTGNNLLNTAYYDHLSRFKYFGILNPGRNIVLTMKLKFIGS